MEAFFLPGPAGRLFCTYRAGSGTGPGRSAIDDAPVLVLPPFAEELNKSRRMLALFAQRAQRGGIATLIPDLLGTGDSDGDFGDATLEAWTADLRCSLDWLAMRSTGPVSVLALRSGALLLHLLPEEMRSGGRLVLWQPVVSGKTFVNQFLRLKLASGLLTGNEVQVDSTALRRELERAGRLEVAGYDVRYDLLRGMEGLELRSAAVDRYSSVAAFEIGGMDSSDVSPALTRVLAGWRGAGGNVSGCTVAGDPFWATAEIATVPALLDQTIGALVGHGDPQ